MLAWKIRQTVPVPLDYRISSAAIPHRITSTTVNLQSPTPLLTDTTSTMPPINAKTLTMPLAAFTMAFLLLAYTRTSISAARSNARLQREVGGNWGGARGGGAREDEGELEVGGRGEVG